MLNIDFSVHPCRENEKTNQQRIFASYSIGTLYKIFHLTHDPLAGLLLFVPTGSALRNVTHYILFFRQFF